MGVRADRWQAASHGRVLRGLSEGLGWSGYWQMVRTERWNYINSRFNPLGLGCPVSSRPDRGGHRHGEADHRTARRVKPNRITGSA